MYQNDDKRIQIDTHKIVIDDPSGSLSEIDAYYFEGIEQIDELHIQAKNLLVFPDILLNMSVTKRVYLSNALCKSLPPFVSQSTNLQHLELDCSQLRKIDGLLEFKRTYINQLL